MSINGVGLPRPRRPAATSCAARLERNATTFTGVPAPLDIDPAAIAGTGTGRSNVAVAADGIATVGLGRGAATPTPGAIFELRLSAAPQDLRATGADDAPTSPVEDDSSFAWVVFRQRRDGGPSSRAGLVGSAFDDAGRRSTGG